MKMIYLASPYSHPDPDVRRLRYEAVEVIAAALIKQGYCVFAPIAYTHQMATRHDINGDFTTWMEFDAAFIERSDELWIATIEGWGDSRGVAEETSMAIAAGLPIRFIDPVTLNVSEPV